MIDNTEQIKDITEQLEKLRAILTSNINEERFTEVSSLITDLETVKEKLEKEAITKNNDSLATFVRDYETTDLDGFETENYLFEEEKPKTVKSICGDTNLVDVQKEITTLDELEQALTFQNIVR